MRDLPSLNGKRPPPHSASPMFSIPPDLALCMDTLCSSLPFLSLSEFYVTLRRIMRFDRQSTPFSALLGGAWYQVFGTSSALYLPHACVALPFFFQGHLDALRCFTQWGGECIPFLGGSPPPPSRLSCTFKFPLWVSPLDCSGAFRAPRGQILWMLHPFPLTFSYKFLPPSPRPGRSSLWSSSCSSPPRRLLS